MGGTPDVRQELAPTCPRAARPHRQHVVELTAQHLAEILLADAPRLPAAAAARVLVEVVHQHLDGPFQLRAVCHGHPRSPAGTRIGGRLSGMGVTRLPASLTVPSGRTMREESMGQYKAGCPVPCITPKRQHLPRLPPRGGRPRAWDGEAIMAPGPRSARTAAPGSQGSLGRNGAGSGGRAGARRWREGRNYRPAFLLLHGAGNTPAGLWVGASHRAGLGPVSQGFPQIPRSYPACERSVRALFCTPLAAPSQEAPSYGGTQRDGDRHGVQHPRPGQDAHGRGRELHRLVRPWLFPAPAGARSRGSGRAEARRCRSCLQC